MRQAESNRFEVVDELDRGEAELPLQLGGVDQPAGIGEAATALFDRAGNRENGDVDRLRCGMLVQKAAQRRDDAGMGAHVEAMDRPKRPVAHQREADVGAADIGEERGHHDAARAASARISPAYHRDDSLGIRRWLG